MITASLSEPSASRLRDQTGLLGEFVTPFEGFPLRRVTGPGRWIGL